MKSILPAAWIVSILLHLFYAYIYPGIILANIMYWFRFQPAERSISLAEALSETLFEYITVFLTIWPIIYIAALIVGWGLYKDEKIATCLLIALGTTIPPIAMLLAFF